MCRAPLTRPRQPPLNRPRLPPHAHVCFPRCPLTPPASPPRPTAPAAMPHPQALLAATLVAVVLAASGASAAPCASEKACLLHGCSAALATNASAFPYQVRVHFCVGVWGGAVGGGVGVLGGVWVRRCAWLPPRARARLPRLRAFPTPPPTRSTPPPPHPPPPHPLSPPVPPPPPTLTNSWTTPPLPTRGPLPLSSHSAPSPASWARAPASPPAPFSCASTTRCWQTPGGWSTCAPLGGPSAGAARWGGATCGGLKTWQTCAPRR